MMCNLLYSTLCVFDIKVESAAKTCAANLKDLDPVLDARIEVTDTLAKLNGAKIITDYLIFLKGLGMDDTAHV